MTHRRIRTIDAHTGGEPLRVVVDGWPEPEGATMLEKRRRVREHHDNLRRALMLEPRGHADMYGAVPTAPVTPDGDVGVLFCHNEGWSTMCGHGIIALCKVGIEHGLFEVDRNDPVVRIDTPAGRVTARATLEGGTVTAVSFINVASFVLRSDLAVPVDGLGEIRCDVAFGGAFYAYVDAETLDLELTTGQLGKIVDLGRRIKRAVSGAIDIAHPEGDADLGFLYGTIFVAPGVPPVHSRNVCVFADGEVDRSPTGTGVSGRAAIHHARGELGVGETMTIESIVGSRFDVRVVEATPVGELSGIISEVTGSAHVTGIHEFILDPADPFRDGFLLR